MFLELTLLCVLDITKRTFFGLWWRLWFLASGLLDSQFGLLLLGPGVLEPDLDDAFLEADLSAQIGALHHGGGLVELEHCFHHFDLDTGHLGPEPF